MTRFLVQYTEMVEVTYEQWVEADNKKEALEMVKEDPHFENAVSSEGVGEKDFIVIKEE